VSQRYDEAWVAGMLSPARAALAPPEALLAHVGARAGATVVDIGCGPGFFTLPAARLVGVQGRVYAVDVEPRMLALVERRAAESGLRNITTVRTRAADVPLSDGCAEVVVCGLVLHDLDAAGRGQMVGEMARLCRRGGAVLVVEWQPRSDETRWNRLTPEETGALLARAGLRVEETAALGGAAQPAGEGDGMYRVLGRREDG
jgi:ubiquinone/menaquinone biosynthesis C-methylase UbiE